MPVRNLKIHADILMEICKVSGLDRLHRETCRTQNIMSHPILSATVKKKRKTHIV
jgi:hypothetical protein